MVMLCIIYDPEMKLDTTKRLERTQYSAALAVTGAWRGDKEAEAI